MWQVLSLLSHTRASVSVSQLGALSLYVLVLSSLPATRTDPLPRQNRTWCACLSVHSHILCVWWQCCAPVFVATSAGLATVTITTGVPGDGGCDIGVDRFPSGKEKHLTFHIYSACSTCAPPHVTTQYTLSHINGPLKTCYFSWNVAYKYRPHRTFFLSRWITLLLLQLLPSHLCIDVWMHASTLCCLLSGFLNATEHLTNRTGFLLVCVCVCMFVCCCSYHSACASPREGASAHARACVLYMRVHVKPSSCLTAVDSWPLLACRG